MREIIRKFTMGHAKQMIGPVTWLFLEGVSISFPAIAVYFARRKAALPQSWSGGPGP